MASFVDVIAAISTPLGKGGVSVIRMSGNGAIDIADKVFKPISGRVFSDHPARMQVYGNVVYSGERIDDALATYFNEGSSYTGEETVEISCHGGTLVTGCVLEALLSSGARAAEAGEFTKRAYINGRLSLTEAEAIGDLLDAKSREQIRLAGIDSRQRLDAMIRGIKNETVALLSSSYARIDYPDEDLGDFSDREYCDKLDKIIEDLKKLADTYRTGKAINEGIDTVICGKPNVGKSTLYNLLAGEELAIVTDISGTTRDVLERTVPLGRVVLKLADTAGIRDSGDVDKVEKIGIERSVKRIENAELIFAMFDLSRELDHEDDAIIEAVTGSHGARIAILNKSDAKEVSACLFDRERIFSAFDERIEISARDGGADAIIALKAIVERMFTDERITVGQDAIVSSARQHSRIIGALELLSSARAALESGLPQDLASSDIERALSQMSEIDGRGVSEEIISDIFSKFCVGK